MIASNSGRLVARKDGSSCPNESRIRRRSNNLGITGVWTDFVVQNVQNKRMGEAGAAMVLSVIQ